MLQQIQEYLLACTYIAWSYSILFTFLVNTSSSVY